MRALQNKKRSRLKNAAVNERLRKGVRTVVLDPYVLALAAIMVLATSHSSHD